MKTPGTVLGYSVNGHHEIKADGYRSVLDLDTPLEMTKETSFDVGSLTKIVFTTSTLMNLVQLGEIQLENPVAKFLPTWSTTEKSNITIEQLLQHRSGLWEWRPFYLKNSSPQDVYRNIAELPLRYSPNMARHYSDLGFMVLGEIISVVMGSLSQVANLSETQFAKPTRAEVASTSRGDRIERIMVESNSPFPVDESADGFSGWRSRVLTGEVNDGNSFHALQGTSGHAGLFTTAKDLLIWGDWIQQHEQFLKFTEDGPDENAHLGFRSWTHTHGNCTDRFFGHTGFPGVALGISSKHGATLAMLTNRLHVDTPPLQTEELWAPELSKFHAELHRDI